MRYRSKIKNTRVAWHLIVGLMTGLFVISLAYALHAEVYPYWERFIPAKSVSCGDELTDGHFELTKNLTCTEDPAIKITGPAELNLQRYTVSGNGDNICIDIKGDGATVQNGTVMQCEEGIRIKKGDYNKVIGVKAYNNEKRGFKIDEGHENLLYNCQAKDNKRKGFSIEKGFYNELVKCCSINNGQQGYNIEGGAGNTISYSKAYANCRDGIEIAKKGTENWVVHNTVEDNGNREVCDSFAEDPENPDDDYYYKPWFYAGIDIRDDSEYNEIRDNHACGNLGCSGSDENECTARKRNYWDENVDDNGYATFTNKWINNSVCPELEGAADLEE